MDNRHIFSRSRRGDPVLFFLTVASLPFSSPSRILPLLLHLLDIGFLHCILFSLSLQTLTPPLSRPLRRPERCTTPLPLLTVPVHPSLPAQWLWAENAFPPSYTVPFTLLVLSCLPSVPYLPFLSSFLAFFLPSLAPRLAVPCFQNWLVEQSLFEHRLCEIEFNPLFQHTFLFCDV